LLTQVGNAARAAETLLMRARRRVAATVSENGAVAAHLVEREQHAVHALAWFATCAGTLRQLASHAERLRDEGRLGEIEQVSLRVAAGEYLSQLAGGIPMNQAEFARPADIGLTPDDVTELTKSAAGLLAPEPMRQARAMLVELLIAGAHPASAGDDELGRNLGEMRATMRRFVETKVAPHAHGWHLRNEYVPLALVAELSKLGVFSLTVPEEWGGAGQGKEAMCVVSEELSRGWLAVGSFGTRAEIASELILHGGTDEQKRRWLPGIAGGEILPTAVFTEPDTGSDLGALRTRAIRDGDRYRITGSKTWITHPVRADIMLLLARTDPAKRITRACRCSSLKSRAAATTTPFPPRA
jgi:(2S)-methylsuccinyl-CoA dehydrogenase